MPDDKNPDNKNRENKSPGHSSDERQPDESFKVIDRRPFTSEGELRPEAIDEERREREAAARIEKTQQDIHSSRAGAKVATDSGPGSSGAPGAYANSSISGVAPGSAGANPLRPSRNFQMLIDFLARNCAALLGGMADPRTGQPLLDLEGAREMIDMLDAVREFSRGNLADEDDQLLVEVIGGLKLSFMDVSKAAAAAAAAPGKARGVKP